MVDRNGYATVYEYDANGNRTAVHYANGLTTTYDYDLLNRLICEKTIDIEDNIVVQYTYTLGVAGERKSVTELNRSVEYTYDSLYRLTSETITEGEKVTVYTYAYDNVSNRILKTVNGEETVYTYNALNQLVSDSETTYEYDLNGNLVRVIGSAHSALYEYNAENKLVKATVQNGSLVIEESYTYDYGGNRTSKTTHRSDGVTEYVKYLNDNSSLTNVLAEIDENGTVKCTYTIGADLVSQERDGNVSVYLYDGHGSVVGLSNESGVVTDTYSYDAFGNLLKSTGSTKNCYRYCGEQFDETTGLYYLRARYMDTSTGRFISQDTYQGTINDPVSLHKYLYANANPVMYSDPSGYTSLGEMVCVSAAISGICMATINAAAYLDGLVSINDFNIWDFGSAIIEGFLAGVCIGALFGLAFYGISFALALIAEGLNLAFGWALGIVGVWQSLAASMTEYQNHNYCTSMLLWIMGWMSYFAVLSSVFSYGGLSGGQNGSANAENSKRIQLEQNKAQGKAFERQQVEKLSKEYDNLVEQITIKVQLEDGTYVNTRVDAIGFDSQGNIVIFEFKSSQTAPLTTNQGKAFPVIDVKGGEVVGKGKGDFVGGTQIPPTNVQIIRP